MEPIKTENIGFKYVNGKLVITINLGNKNLAEDVAYQINGSFDHAEFHGKSIIYEIPEYPTQNLTPDIVQSQVSAIASFVNDTHLKGGKNGVRNYGNTNFFQFEGENVTFDKPGEVAKKINETLKDKASPPKANDKPNEIKNNPKPNKDDRLKEEISDGAILIFNQFCQTHKLSNQASIYLYEGLNAKKDETIDQYKIDVENKILNSVSDLHLKQKLKESLDTFLEKPNKFDAIISEIKEQEKPQKPNLQIEHNPEDLVNKNQITDKETVAYVTKLTEALQDQRFTNEQIYFIGNLTNNIAGIKTKEDLIDVINKTVTKNESYLSAEGLSRIKGFTNQLKKNELEVNTKPQPLVYAPREYVGQQQLAPDPDKIPKEIYPDYNDLESITHLWKLDEKMGVMKITDAGEYVGIQDRNSLKMFNETGVFSPH